MRKTLLAAIMAASALIPAAAMAQDNPDRPTRGEGQPHPQQQRQGGGQPRQGGAQPQRQATPGAEGRTQWQRPSAPAQAQAPIQAQPQVQAAPQQRASGRPDGQAGGRGYRGGDRGQQFQGNPGQQQGRDQFQGQTGGRPDVNGGRDGRQGFNGDPRDNRGGYQQGRGPDYRGNDGRGNDGRGNDGRGYNGGYNNANRGSWSRDWRRDNRYNYNVYRNQNRNAYHLPRYYAPYGWDGGYRRFGIGFSLSSILFDQSYWIEDTDYYRLPPAYGPYRWVRYYNDALLVDIRTGQVVDTVYDIFW